MRRAPECAGRGGEGKVSGDTVASRSRVFAARLTVSLYRCSNGWTVLRVWHKLECPLSSCY